MNAPGEIAPLARLARPHVAIVTTVEAVHLAAFRDIRGIAREKAAIFEGLEPGGAAVLNRDTPTYPILLAAARRAGARVVRFGSIGRPEFRLGEVHLGEAGTSAAATAPRPPLPLPPRRPRPAPRDERPRRPRRRRGARRRPRPRRGRARPLAAARGPRRALDGAARPRRPRRRDHPDRRELQRQSRGDGGRLRGLRRRPARRRHRTRRPRAGASPSSATCSSSGRASASCTPASPRCRRWPRLTTVHCAGERMRALHEALPRG